MTENQDRFCIYNKSTDDNVYDNVENQDYSWETIVMVLNAVIPNLLDR